LQFVLEKNVGKGLISVEDLKGSHRTKVGTTKNKISMGHYTLVGHTFLLLRQATK